ncbi:SDR family oxidoreductase [Harryflintia acetispora]|uniref:SDR family oxidoreductase n=1 Tax=Harryflintia acetispora TaxID=1849041 RepID=UPI0018990689|nr:SDR family oxidoreductase [Harryflintia acetispora]
MNDDKTLLITGASSDVGLSLIRKVAKNYQRIIAHYHHSDQGLLLLKEEVGEKIVSMQADFTDLQSTLQFAEKVIGDGTSPDHFIHLPAPPLNNNKFSKSNWSDFEVELSTSFRSAVILCQKILPLMAKKKLGKVVFMPSYCVVNQPAMKFAVPYTSTKYALLGLMKCLSAEYADKGVTVNGVSPSMINTKFLAGVPELVIQKNALESPLKRNLQVQDILSAFDFFLSDGADCITGQNLAVTGGK